MPDDYCGNRKISVVTPTLRRMLEVSGLLENLCNQTLKPFEVILVDGAPAGERDTEELVARVADSLPFAVRYIRRDGGTAIQRNVGIDAATGDFIAFIDDDIRLEPEFFQIMLDVFATDTTHRVGGLAGYITNQYLNPGTSRRWQWYRRLRLFGTYEPGRYDFKTGYPINRYLCPPHEELREIDFMGAGCAVWCKEVFGHGLRFSEFFKDYGILEDAHFALRARLQWTLLECGRAHCIHLRSPSGRAKARQIARKTAVNYRYVFVDVVRNRTWSQEVRFWTVQGFDLFRFFAHAVRSPHKDHWLTVLGKIEGIVEALGIRPSLDGQAGQS